MLSYCLASLPISLFFFLSSTRQLTPSEKPSSHPIAFPFFLPRDLWLGECWRQAITMSCLNSSVRQSGRGGGGDIRGAFCRRHTLSPPTCLRCLSPALTLLQWLLGLPHRLVFHQRRAAAPFSPSNFAFSPHLTQGWVRSCVCLAENHRFTPQVYNNIQEFDTDTEIFRHFGVKMSVDT